MSALEAAEREGGDIRGKQSAAMLIASGEPKGVSWKDIDRIKSYCHLPIIIKKLEPQELLVAYL